MSTTIDGLVIEISENSNEAVNGLDALTKALERLKKTTGDLGKSLDGVNFDKFSKQMRQLSTALQPLQGFKTQAGGLLSALRHFKQTAEDLNDFSGFGRFSGQIELLADSLQPLSGVGSKLGATLNALGEVPNISNQLETVDFDTFSNQISTLTQSLSPLGTIQSKLGSTLNQLTRFSQVTQQLDVALKDTNLASNILELVNALGPLSLIDKSNLGSVLNQIKKIPDITKQLKDTNLDEFANQIDRVVTALRPLAIEMNKISSGFSVFPSRIQRIITQNSRLASSNKKLGDSYNVLGINFRSVRVQLGVLYVALRKASNIMAEWVVESNDYVENLNLFTVSMRGSTDAALKYAYEVKDAFGIDPSEWIRFQAVFQNMYTGFGVTADKATTMSKVLTQLGYDLATIFNVDYSVAMEKLQSAIAGQPRPMREWGFDMSEATLKLVAMRHGIEENVETMTQYEKSQLRFVQLMETADKQGILGNFARELITPANAMRILNQQVLLLKRALGNMLIPVLIQIVPYVQAFVQVLTQAANHIANIFGFQLPQIDYSGMDELGGSIDDISDGFDDATESAKGLQRTLAAFDEINLLSEPSGAKSSNADFDLGIDLEQYDYNFISQIDTKVKQIVERIQGWFTEFKDELTIIGDIVKAIGVAFLAWKIGNAIIDGISGIRKQLTDGLSKIVMGITLMVTGFTLEYSGAFQIGKGDATTWDYVKTGLGAALGVAGSLLTFGTGPVGWLVGVGMAITVLVTGIMLGNQERISDMVKDAFYSGGDGITISEIAIKFEQLTLSMTQDMQTVIEGQKTIDGLKESIKDTNVSIGEISRAWTLGIIDTDNAVNSLESHFERLRNNTGTILDEIYENIVNAIGGSFGVALIDAGYSVDVVIQYLKDIKNEGSTTMTTLSDEMDELNKKYEAGTINVEEYQDKYSDLVEQMNSIITTGSETRDIFDDIGDSLGSIDWEKPEAVDEFFDAISSASDRGQKDVSAYFDSVRDNLSTFRDLTGDPANKQLIQNLIEVATKAEAKDLATIDANLSEIFNAIQEDMLFKTNVAIEKATNEWNEMNWVQQLFTSKDEYVNKALQDYQENIVNPISNSIRKSLKTLNMDGSVFASDAMESIIRNMFTYDEVHGAYVKGFGAGLTDETYNELNRYGIDTQAFAEETGMKIPEGLFYGAREQLDADKSQWEAWSEQPMKWFNSINEIDSSESKVFKDLGSDVALGLLKGVDEGTNKKNYDNIFTRIINAFKTLFGIHSPSTVFKDLGGDLMQGLLNGMQGWDAKFTNIFKNVVNAGIELFNKFINWVNSKMRFGWDAVKIAGKTIVPSGSIQLFRMTPIQKMAEGGFPQIGQLFIANEAGPELIGNIGNRTAVANTNQIVEAVAQGVYEAVTTALRLRSNNNEGSNEVVMNVDGRTFARLLLPKINDEAQRLGYKPILTYEGGSL